jgi:hypothetical protein
MYKLLSFLLLLLSNKMFAQQSNFPSGVYAVSVMAQMPNSAKTVEILPTDSIFFYKNFGLEKLSSIQDLEVDNYLTRTVVSSGFNLIDWDKGTFVRIEKLISPTKWAPKSLKQQREGVDFYFQYYNDEKYTVEYIPMNNTKLKKIVYISTIERTKGAQVTAFFDMSKKNIGPKIMVNLENKFGGRLIELNVKFPDNKGSQIWKIKYLPLKQHKYIDFLKKLAK